MLSFSTFTFYSLHVMQKHHSFKRHLFSAVFCVLFMTCRLRQQCHMELVRGLHAWWHIRPVHISAPAVRLSLA